MSIVKCEHQVAVPRRGKPCRGFLSRRSGLLLRPGQG